MAQYTIGQQVRTVYGETATIYRVEDTGESYLYECWIAGQGMTMVHETKLNG